MMKDMEFVGAVAGALTLVGYLPQTVKTIRTRRTKDLSLMTFCVIGVSALLWTIYGFSKGLPSIWLTNAVVTACNVVIISIKLSAGKP
jgi:MtN3 and saliva related transmembrane protein